MGPREPACQPACLPESSPGIFSPWLPQEEGNSRAGRPPRTRDRGRQGLNPAPGNRTPGGLGGAILEKPRQRPSTWAEAWMGLAEAQPPSISHGAHAPQEPELDPGLFQSSF